jgi:hypothetical protein
MAHTLRTVCEDGKECAPGFQEMAVKDIIVSQVIRFLSSNSCLVGYKVLSKENKAEDVIKTTSTQMRKLQLRRYGNAESMHLLTTPQTLIL